MSAEAKMQWAGNSYINEQSDYRNFVRAISKKAHELGLANSHRFKRLAHSIEFSRRLASVSCPESETSFWQDLVFFEGQGGLEEPALQRVLINPAFENDLVIGLLRRIDEKWRAPRVTVFASSETLNESGLALRIIEEYPAFCVVSASDETVSELKRRFPVGFAELRGTMPASAPAVTTDRRLLGGQPRVMNYCIVHFGLPIRDEWKDRLQKVGGKILQPHGAFALVVSASDKAIKEISGFREVTEVEPFEPDLRIRSHSVRGLGGSVEAESSFPWADDQSPSNNRSAVLPGVYVASFFTKEESDNAARELSKEGIEVLDRPSATMLVLNITETDDALKDLLKIIEQAGLCLLEEETIEMPSNDVARMVVGKGIVSPHHVFTQFPITGKGEVVAIADSGLDTGFLPTLHLDFKDRVRAIQSYPIRKSLNPYIHNRGADKGPADLYSGHGTHVAGSAIGNGAQAAALGLPQIQGIAPDAELIFQAVEQIAEWDVGLLHKKFPNHPAEPFGLYGIPEDLTTLFEFAYNHGARVHSNSWGTTDKQGAYTGKCQKLDAFVWDHKDFLVIVAAGNEATQKGESISPMSVIPPGTAKNCLTVGACENDRPGQFSTTYGDWWPRKFTGGPFKSKTMVESIDHIVPFSGRGPCAPAGRRKPDVVAPGTFILSTRSAQMPANHFGWNSFPEAKRHYMYMGGTSMAAPLIAGAAILVRQFLRTEHQITNPSAALVKAALIHSAVYMNCPNRHVTSSPWSDNEQGWGRVCLENILAPPVPVRTIFIDESTGLRVGEKKDYTVQITDTSVPLKITLAYSDYFGGALVNNLNLQLFAPDGSYYLGNDFDGSGNPDDLNNVEGIVVEPKDHGNWTIRVIASTVSFGPQDYALVISGGV